MKKNNNKFRNNSNNNSNYHPAYSLNYKFDSNSIAGKISGTALDLIKKYNELAKDAQNDNDYVRAEVFRQYAEHYRKIVTDINEKKNAQGNSYNNKRTASEKELVAAEQDAAVEPVASQIEPNVAEALAPAKKEFKIIEISEAKKEQADKPKRTYRKKASAQ